MPSIPPKPKRDRTRTSTAADRKAVDQFLVPLLQSLERSLEGYKRHRVAELHPSVGQQMAYWENSISCLKWVLKLNRQRRKE